MTRWGHRERTLGKAQICHTLRPGEPGAASRGAMQPEKLVKRAWVEKEQRFAVVDGARSHKKSHGRETPGPSSTRANSVVG
jgi:hypothetical protein